MEMDAEIIAPESEATNTVEPKDLNKDFKNPNVYVKFKKKNCPDTFVQLPVEKPEQEDNQNKQVISSPLPTIELKYTEPSWSGMPVCQASKYSFDLLKSGVIIENIDLMCKQFHLFGRIQNCDIIMAHPTISRHHAVLQFNVENTPERPMGFYIYDLGSTHGTFLNKNRIKSRMYVRVQVGYILKFGNSTRHFIMQGPEEDTEPESNLTVTELKEKRLLEIQEKERVRLENIELERINAEKAAELERETGIDWGMSEDANEETDLTENPYAATNNEDQYIDDPKKTLRGFFERVGGDLEYNVEERGVGHFCCRIELPIENANGRPIIAEATVKGKKKEAVVQCALEACRLLDRAGILRQARQESRKRKSKNWEDDDFYESDDDEFLDRTGAVQMKRERRMRILGVINDETVETYSSLVLKEKNILSQIAKVEKALDVLHRQSQQKASKSTSDDVDALDAFMDDLVTLPDTQKIRKYKVELAQLRQEHLNLQKMLTIAKPVMLPPLIERTTGDNVKPATVQSKGPTIGKRIKTRPPIRNKTHTSCLPKQDNLEESEVKQERNISIEKHPFSTKKKQKPPSTVRQDPSRIIGPQIFDENNTLPNMAKSDISADCSTKSRKRNEKYSAKQIEKTSTNYGNAQSSEDYSMWMPPEDQQGDGKTKLNEKLGY